MRLLDKKSVTIQQAEERRKQIEEGATLAKKIDKLREASSSEEMRLQKIRKATLETIQADIVRASSQLTLVKEQAVARDTESKMMRISVEEREIRVAQDRTQLAKEKRAVAKQELELQKVAAQQKRMAEELAAERVEIASVKEVAEKERNDAVSIKEVAEKYSNRVRMQCRKVIDKASEGMKVATELGKTNAKVAKELDLERQTQAAQKKALDERERRLLDREATHARNLQRFERLKNHG